MKRLKSQLTRLLTRLDKQILEDLKQARGLQKRIRKNDLLRQTIKAEIYGNADIL